MASTVVDYGKWGELTYQELWDQQPEYCLWTINKFQELVKEGEELDTKYIVGESKMKRLAQWIKQTDKLRAAIDPEVECDSDMEMVELQRPGTETLAQKIALSRAEKTSQSSKFYGVAFPEEHAGIYTTWDECKPHVHGIKGVMYKSFGSEEDALEYVQNPPPRKNAEAQAAKEKAKAQKEEAKAAKVAEAKASKEAKEEAKAAKAAEAKKAKAAKAEKRKHISDNAEGEQTKRSRKDATSVDETELIEWAEIRRVRELLQAAEIQSGAACAGA